MSVLPLVSVLMTAYNREKYIAEAIESVLVSTFKEFELIVVDDCSTDRTVEIARQYETKDTRVKVYVNEKNLGDYPNRNKAASYAKGKYIKYLDSDDIIYPHGLEVMVKAMEQFPEAGWGLCAIADPARAYPVCITPEITYLEHFYGYGHFDRAPGSAIIKKSVFVDIGGFSGKPYIGDTELWFRIASQHCLVKFSRDLVWDRSHNESQKVYEKKDQTVRKIRKEMVFHFLSSQACPLSKDQKEMVKRAISKRKLKNFIKNAF